MPGQRGSETRVRENIIRVRMADAELAQLDRKRGTWSRAHFLRRAVSHVGEMRSIEVKPLLAELRRIGSNLNQLARAANSRSDVIEPQALQVEIARLAAAVEHLSNL